MLQYEHRVKVVRVPDGTLSFTVLDQSPVALWGPAPDADPAVFPLDTPVSIVGETDKITALGASGELQRSMNNMIIASGGRYAPPTVVVRTAEGTNIDPQVALEETISNMVGSAADLTGWHAFKTARAVTGIKPKRYMAPGYSHQRVGGLANPIVTDIFPYLERQRARMYFAGPSTTRDAAVAARADWSSMALSMVDPRVTDLDTATSTVVAMPPEPFVIGAGTKVMEELGFWHSVSNKPMGGFSGTERPISHDISDRETEAHFLNENRVNTIVRDRGWRYWGGLTLADNDQWMFENVVVVRHAIEEMVAEDFAPIIDAPMNAPVVVDALSSLNDKLSEFQEAGAILGGRAFFLPELNQTGALRRGQLRVEFDAEETPPIHGLEIGSRRNVLYFDNLIEDIVRDLAAAA